MGSSNICLINKTWNGLNGQAFAYCLPFLLLASVLAQGCSGFIGSVNYCIRYKSIYSKLCEQYKKTLETVSTVLFLTPNLEIIM